MKVTNAAQIRCSNCFQWRILLPEILRIGQTGLPQQNTVTVFFFEAFDEPWKGDPGNPQGAEGMANFKDSELDSGIESAEECPGECIFIEP